MFHMKQFVRFLRQKKFSRVFHVKHLKNNLIIFLSVLLFLQYKEETGVPNKNHSSG